jgi:hypothetical protein
VDVAGCGVRGVGPEELGEGRWRKCWRSKKEECLQVEEAWWRKSHLSFEEK